MTSPELVLVDDHVLVAQTLALALRQRGFAAHRCPDQSADAVVAAVQERPGALVLLDLDLGAGRRGEDLVPALRRLGADVLILSGAGDPVRLGAALAAGAIGWAPKSLPFEHLVDVVAAATAGHSPTAPAERADLVRRYRRAADDRAADDERLDRLTAREREVLGLLASGQPADEIARELFVSVATVRSQIRSLLAKLDVHSQLAAVAFANRVGIRP